MYCYISILLGLLLIVMFPHNTFAATAVETGKDWVVDINVSSEDSEVIYTENAWRIENMAPGDEFHTQINIYNDSQFPLQIVSITSSGMQDDVTPEEKEFAHQFIFTLSKDGETVLTGRLDAALYVPQAVRIEPYSTVTYDLTITFLESAGNEYQGRSYSDGSFNLIFSVTEYTDEVEEVIEIIFHILIKILSEIKERLEDFVGAIADTIVAIIDAIIEKIKDFLGIEDGTDGSGDGNTDGSGSGDGSSDGSSSGDGSSDGTDSGDGSSDGSNSEDGSSDGSSSGDGSSDGSSSGDGSSDGSGSGDGSSDGTGSGDGANTTGVLADSGLIIIVFVGLVHSAATASAIWTRFTQDANSIRYEYFKLLFRRKRNYPEDMEDFEGLEDIEKEIYPFEDGSFTEF